MKVFLFSMYIIPAIVGMILLIFNYKGLKVKEFIYHLLTMLIPLVNFLLLVYYTLEYYDVCVKISKFLNKKL